MKNPSLRMLLITLLLPLFILMGAALFMAGLNHTRDFLQRQLASHAQDAATALALRLTPAFSANDGATIANAVDALYDSGFFQSIRLRKPGGMLLLAREATPRVEDVPAWFMRLLPIATPEGKAEVTSAWRQAASISIVSHPGYAYLQLWQNARATLLWTLAFGALGAVLLLWLLNRALRPLAAMERLALDVGEGRFPRLQSTPRIRELGHIGAALDRMSASVERMLAEKVHFIDQLREELHHDPMTGLANRAYFQSALAVALARQGATGGLILVQVADLARLNARLGREQGDRLLQEVAKAVGHAGARHHALAARLDGSQFALLLDGKLGEDLLAHAEDLARDIDRLIALHGIAGETTAHAGAAAFDGQDPAALLARADAALRDASLGPSGSARLTASAAPGKQAMREQLRETLRTASLELAWQPVLRCADRAAAHHEALARLPDGRGGTLPAGTFIGLAEADGLVATLDRLVLTQATLALAERGAGACTVNVSPASLHEAAFVSWLHGHGHQAGRLCLECALGRDNAAGEAMAALRGLKQAGFPIVLDRFIPNADTLAQLAELRPAWVKVEGALCRHAVDHPGTRMLLRGLCEYAHDLDIRVAASGVEREADIAPLCELGMDAVQGWAFGQPVGPGQG